MALTLTEVRTKLRNQLDDNVAVANQTWSDTELNQYIEEGIFFLSSGQKPTLWIETYDESITTTINETDYTIPANIFRIFDIRQQISSGSDIYKVLRRWKIFGNVIRIAYMDRPGQTDLIFKIFGAKKFTVLTEVPDEYERIILNYAVSRAFDQISSKMTQFNKYSAKLQNISRNDVRLKGKYFRDLAEKEKIENKKPMKPVYAGVNEF